MAAGPDGVGPQDIERRDEEAPEAVTLEQVRAWCERDEATLRNQHPPEGRLPPEAEEQLARYDSSTMTGALRRWGYLKHLFHRRRERKGRKDAQAKRAARQLLRREPVRLQLGGHTVDITARSYAALYEIAAHALRVRELEADRDRIAELHARTEEALRERRGFGARRRGRRRLRRLGRLYRRVFAEILLHRRAIYAHALTPSGAPAASIEEAPDWWEEIDPVWDGALLAAVFEAGPGRYAQLGEPPPERSGRGGSDRPEDFGWASLFASIERQQRTEAAALYDQDLWRLLTWLRAGAPPAPEGLDG